MVFLSLYCWQEQAYVAYSDQVSKKARLDLVKLDFNTISTFSFDVSVIFSGDNNLTARFIPRRISAMTSNCSLIIALLTTHAIVLIWLPLALRFPTQLMSHA